MLAASSRAAAAEDDEDDEEEGADDDVTHVVRTRGRIFSTRRALARETVT